MLRDLRREICDLLVLDWQLPDVSGLEVVRWVRSNLDHRMPILFVTNHREERDLVEGLAAGADDFMLKPIRVRAAAPRVCVPGRRGAGLRACARAGCTKKNPAACAAGFFEERLSAVQQITQGRCLSRCQPGPCSP